jgi:hypothetical protein
MEIYKAINAVQSSLSRTGISKDHRNQQQGYNFRGIDDVYCALSPLLAEHGLCILPRVLSRECVERTTQKGGVLFYVTVEVEFDFVSATDGSKHTVKTFGEAMDSGDKATNKAMSAAYKYAAFQAFAIPTEGDNDADATTHEVAARAKPAKANTVNPKNDPFIADMQLRLDAAKVTIMEFVSWWNQQLNEGQPYEQIKALADIPDSWREYALSLYDAPAAAANVITEAQGKLIFAKMKAAGTTEKDYISQFGYAIDATPKGQMNAALDWIAGKC